MKFDFQFKVTKKHLRYVLIVLAGVLIAVGLLGVAGHPLPDKVASDLSNGVIFCALIVFLYNHKLRSDEAKALAAKAEEAKAEEAKAEEGIAVTEIEEPELKKEG